MSTEAGNGLVAAVRGGWRNAAPLFASVQPVPEPALAYVLPGSNRVVVTAPPHHHHPRAATSISWRTNL
ncbi:MAG: hypothetical protein IPN53_04280 [Comamonadaceae bacterium]|nr:hypothetical protein [Comamonadaceae bacterium]